jgi:hypothetical protein
VISKYNIRDHIPAEYHFVLDPTYRTIDAPDDQDMFKAACSNQFLFSAAYLSITNKRGDTVPLVANDPQIRYKLLKRRIKKLMEKDPTILMRIIILKARQFGMSTWEIGELFTDTILNRNISAGHISHLAPTTSSFLKKDKYFYSNLPKWLSRQIPVSYVKGSNMSVDSNNSQIGCFTAKNLDSGVGTTLNRLHASEVCLWDNSDSLMSALLQVVPDNDTTSIVAESTARGMAGWFYEHWEGSQKKGDKWNGWFGLFLAWHIFDEYQIDLSYEQEKKIKESITEPENELIQLYGEEWGDERTIYQKLAWRRRVVKAKCSNSEKMFDREYPHCPEVAFMTSGGNYFNIVVCKKRKEHAAKVSKAGLLKIGNLTKSISFRDTNFRTNEVNLYDFYEDPYGSLQILKMPEQTHLNRYCIGGDPAKGENANEETLDDPDYCVAFVKDLLDNIVVAMYRARIEEYEFANVLNALSWFYSNGPNMPAKIAVESNINATVLFLKNTHNHENLYYREEISENSLGIKKVKKLGFLTDRVTRDQILINHKKSVNEGSFHCPFEDYWDETLSFINKVKNGKVRAEAKSGSHDDAVMAAAILEECKVSMSSTPIEVYHPEEIADRDKLYYIFKTNSMVR